MKHPLQEWSFLQFISHNIQSVPPVGLRLLLLVLHKNETKKIKFIFFFFITAIMSYCPVITNRSHPKHVILSQCARGIYQWSVQQVYISTQALTPMSKVHFKKKDMQAHISWSELILVITYSLKHIVTVIVIVKRHLYGEPGGKKRGESLIIHVVTFFICVSCCNQRRPHCYCLRHCVNLWQCPWAFVLCLRTFFYKICQNCVA